MAVVNAVLQSYLEFMDKTHQRHRRRAAQCLHQGKGARSSSNWPRRKSRFSLPGSKFGDLGHSDRGQQRRPSDGPAGHRHQPGTDQSPANAAGSNRPRSSAIEAAIRNGENLDQHLLSLEGTLGRELLLASLGFSEHDVEAQAKLEEQLLADRTELRKLQGLLRTESPRHRRGPRPHPHDRELSGQLSTADSTPGSPRSASNNSDRCWCKWSGNGSTKAQHHEAALRAKLRKGPHRSRRPDRRTRAARICWSTT